jgi:uncharacterized protein (TIGR02996 family)
MSLDREALLAAIREAPDDDEPRRVYADWLEEHGQPERAEFIRIQLERWSLPEADPRHAELARREASLLRRHAGTWHHGVPRWASRQAYRRGLLTHVETTLARFARDTGELIHVEPLRSARLTGAARGVAHLAGSPALSVLRELELDSVPLHDAGVRTLAGSVHLANLRVLRLINCGVGPEGAAALAGSPHLARLTTLDLGFYHLPQGETDTSSWRAAALLLNRPGPGNCLGDAGVRALAASPHLGRLERLILAGNEITPAGAAALAGSRRLKRLRGLDLSYNDLGAEGARVLAGSALLKRLRVLELEANELGAPGAAALAESPSSAALRLLDLSGAVRRVEPLLDDEAAAALAGSPHLARLEHLLLGFNRIGPAGAAALARSPHLAGLQSLDLVANRVGNEGARAFADSPLLGRLLILNLDENHIGDDGALALARSPHLGAQLYLRLQSITPVAPTLTVATHRALRARLGDRVHLGAPPPGFTETPADQAE